MDATGLERELLGLSTTGTYLLRLCMLMVLQFGGIVNAWGLHSVVIFGVYFNGCYPSAGLAELVERLRLAGCSLAVFVAVLDLGSPFAIL